MLLLRLGRMAHLAVDGRGIDIIRRAVRPAIRAPPRNSERIRCLGYDPHTRNPLATASIHLASRSCVVLRQRRRPSLGRNRSSQARRDRTASRRRTGRCDGGPNQTSPRLQPLDPEKMLSGVHRPSSALRGQSGVSWPGPSGRHDFPIRPSAGTGLDCPGLRVAVVDNAQGGSADRCHERDHLAALGESEHSAGRGARGRVLPMPRVGAAHPVDLGHPAPAQQRPRP